MFLVVHQKVIISPVSLLFPHTVKSTRGYCIVCYKITGTFICIEHLNRELPLVQIVC